MNLSETTFLLPPTRPEADYRVRIFTPAGELPFAGHPTLGTCQAWLTAGGTPRAGGVIVQECGIGLVALRRDGDRLAFDAPRRIREGALSEAELEPILAALRLQRGAVVAAEWADNGPGWQALLLRSVEEVLAVEVPGGGLGRFRVGLAGLYPPGDDCAVEVRALFEDATGTIREDPATGSLNAALAVWLIESGRVPLSYVASQGGRLGRNARIHVARDHDGTWIGGLARVTVEGTIVV
ncbi:MAG: PhzF family phenazine biosynthesis protein [Myxococcota bacterium]